MTIKELLDLRTPVDRAERDLLLAHALGMPKEYLIVHPETEIPAAIAAKYRGYLKRRAKHEPYAYIVGKRDFYGRTFFVNKDVLIPRPETELIIETVLSVIPTGAKRSGGISPTILDIGCGSGAIGLTLAAELPKARVICADVSAKALAVAKKNAKALGVANRVTFKKADVFKNRSFDFAGASLRMTMVANLPYLPERTWKNAMPDVKKFEPKLALASGKDGLDHYRALMARIAESGITPRMLVLEAEPDQMAELEKIVAGVLPKHDVLPIRDLFGDDRILVATAP